MTRLVLVIALALAGCGDTPFECLGSIDPLCADVVEAAEGAGGFERDLVRLERVACGDMKVPNIYRTSGHWATVRTCWKATVTDAELEIREVVVSINPDNGMVSSTLCQGANCDVAPGETPVPGNEEPDGAGSQ